VFTVPQSPYGYSLLFHFIQVCSLEFHYLATQDILLLLYNYLSVSIHCVLVFITPLLYSHSYSFQLLHLYKLFVIQTVKLTQIAKTETVLTDCIYYLLLATNYVHCFVDCWKSELQIYLSYFHAVYEFYWTEMAFCLQFSTLSVLLL
jgi:hypothetical protein